MTRLGRRNVLDQTKKDVIAALLAVGCSRWTAARYVGCSRSTIANAARRDPEFDAQLRQAKAQAEVGLLKNIRAAAQKEQHWRAAAWALERRYPEKYARRGPQVITVDQIAQLLSQFADIVVEEVPVAEYRKNILKRLEALTKSLGPEPRGDDADD